MVPIGIRGNGRVVSAIAGIAVLAVEIDAVGTGVAEHTIQQNADAPFLCRGGEGVQIGRVTQQRVDAAVIRRVIAVVGVGLKDGVEIDTGDAQGLQIVQLLLYALKVAAEKVVIPHATVMVGTPFGRFGPIAVHHTTGGYPLLRLAGGGKTIRENLIENTARQPIGSGEARLVTGQLPAGTVHIGGISGGAVGLAHQPAATHRHLHPESVPVKAGGGGGVVDTPPLVAVATHTIPGAGKLCGGQVVLQHRQRNGVTTPVAGHAHP